jgi:hypothetical protein
MPRGSISGQGRIQVCPPEGWDVAAPAAVVIIEEPETEQADEQAKVEAVDPGKQGRVRSLRSKLAEVIAPD